MRRAEIVAAARGWLGTPYLHQASLKGAGCDCLGLLRGIWRDILGDEPEAPPAYTPDWAEAGGRETLRDAAARHLLVQTGEPRAGDVLLFRWRAGLPAKHVGILSGATTMIHAHDGAGVTEAPVAQWRRRIAHVFQFPGVTD